MRQFAIDIGGPQPKLRKSPLRLVLCQWRFPPLGCFAPRDVSRFAKALESDYPHTAIDRLQPIEFQVLEDHVEQLPGEAQHVYRFHSDERTWTVSLTEDSLALETTAYEGFDDFWPRWRDLAIAATHRFGIDEELRIGLRYVNELTIDGGWHGDALHDVLAPAILGPITLSHQSVSIERSWQEIRFRFGEEHGCTMQHGYLQNVEGEWVYVLDYDAYREAARPFRIEDHRETLASFNHDIYRIFHDSVTVPTFESFDPRPR